jgi:hypothetical protein
MWSWAPDGYFIPRQTGRLTVGHNVILTSTLTTLLGFLPTLRCLQKAEMNYVRLRNRNQTEDYCLLECDAV